MLTKRIIPCLDIKDGRVVKGTRFENLIDAGDPVKLAKYYNDQGADEISFLDISASYEKRKTSVELAKMVSKELFIPFSVGGGISSIEEIREILSNGAEKVSIGTAAVSNPGLIKQASGIFGSQAIVVSVDAKKISKGKYTLFIKGGREDTGIDVLRFVKKVESIGAGEILLNSIDADGTKKGFDIELIKKVTEAVNIPVIASGGAGGLDDFIEVFKKTEVDAALAASIFHFNDISIKRLKKCLKVAGINVRVENDNT